MTVPGVAARIAVIALLAAAPAALGDFRTNLLATILSFGLFAASLDLLIGYTGLPSLGHAAFFGVGGFAVALLGLHVTSNAFAQLGVATGSGALAAGVVAVFAVRSRGVYFIMLTLAVGELLSQLAISWTSVSGGTNGLAPPVSRLGLGGPGLDQNLHTDRVYYYVLGAFLAGYALLRAIVSSPFGRALVGVRENEARMRSLGYSVTLYKIAAFTIAGAVAGFAGALLVQQQRFVDYTVFSFTNFSALAVIALIIGGRATLAGPVLGGAFVYELRDELSSSFSSQHWPIALGAVFVLVVYLLPTGLVGGGRSLRRMLTATARRSLDQPGASEATP